MTQIILVHGMNATADSWGSVPDKLESVVHMVSPIQLPGHNIELFGAKALSAVNWYSKLFRGRTSAVNTMMLSL